MADLNLQEIHDFMIEVALQAADRITSATPTTDTAGNKKNCMYRNTPKNNSTSYTFYP